MGILVNPSSRRRFANFLCRHDNKLSVLSYAIGIGWFLALAYPQYNARTYFSENALLPALVKSDLKLSSTPAEYLKQLREVHTELKSKDTRAEAPSQHIPTAWLESQFRGLGLEVFVQNFSFQYPGGLHKGRSVAGQNVYAILRAPRAASTEALVISAPYRTPEALDSTAGGIALMLALAKSFRKQTYWAKDLIFLVTEMELMGIQAWLSAYHHTPTPYVEAGELLGRSGSIQAALNLEISGETVSGFDLQPEGLNGQLPNLDLFNTAVRLCVEHNIPPSLHHQASPSQDSLHTMLAGMIQQASGRPTSLHGLFLPYHIEALTLHGINGGSAGFSKMAKVIEGVLRSLNNLLERLHQSFFLYLLPATDRYVSIGLYMPPFGLIVLPLLLKALSLWFHYVDEEKAEGTQKAGGPLALIPVLTMAAFLGGLAHLTPGFFLESAHSLHLPPSDGLLAGSGAILVVGICCPILLRRKGVLEADWRLLKLLGLLAAALLLSATSLYNISLATILAVVWVPSLCLAAPSSWGARLLLLLLPASPLALLYFPPGTDGVDEQPLAEVLGGALAIAVAEAGLLGRWLWPLAVLGLLPIWATFWAVTFIS